MYNETAYEEYMRNVLGYKSNVCDQDLYANNNYYIMPTNTNEIQEDLLNELYPEIYHKIYPVICNICKNIAITVDNETLEKMTDNVINSIEINLKIETKNVRTQQDRQTNHRDNFLRDLIRILILRELTGNNKFPTRPRPPYPGGPGMGPRPPFPGGPGPIRP